MNPSYTIVVLAEHYKRSLWMTFSLYLSTFLTTIGVENSDLKPKFFGKLARLNRSRLSLIYTGELSQHFHVLQTIDSCCQYCHAHSSASLNEAIYLRNSTLA